MNHHDNVPYGMSPMDNLGAVFRNWMFRDFEGIVLTILESFGLPERQEEAAKAQLRKAIWNLWNEQGMIIPNETQEIDIAIMKLLGRDESNIGQKVKRVRRK